MHLFLGEQLTATSIWVDSDIIAVGEGQNELLEVFDKLAQEQKLLAIAPDAGPNKTIRQFVESYPSPKFNSVLQSYPEIENASYLNAGLVFFPDSTVLKDWAIVSSLLEWDTCWEQNALNLICHQNQNRTLILDSRVWNAHAELLKNITVNRGTMYCDGQKCIFAHATSNDARDIGQSQMMFVEKGYVGTGYFRYFANSHLRAAQEKHRSHFLSNNSTSLLDLEILLKRSNIRRNDLCPCGSGKKVKYCDVTYF
jgi:hypothetical protein